METSYINKNLTVLVNSCDKYEDLWVPFFKLFKKYGGDLRNCTIVLNAESKKFSFEGLDIRCPNLYLESENIHWGKRLRNTLDFIDTEFVFVVLDDFFVHRDVDCEVIERCVEWLSNNSSIAMFSLMHLAGANKASEKYEDFCLVQPSTMYRLNAQAGIWRKEILKKSLLDIESPWDWEIYGNMRNDVVIKEQVYALKKGIREPYFYNYHVGESFRSAIMRGKWCTERVDELFKQNGIDIDYSIRGVYFTEPQKKKKRSVFLRSIAKLTRPWRPKAIKAKQERERNMQKFVYPYIE